MIIQCDPTQMVPRSQGLCHCHNLMCTNLKLKPISMPCRVSKLYTSNSTSHQMEDQRLQFVPFSRCIPPEKIDRNVKDIAEQTCHWRDSPRVPGHGWTAGGWRGAGKLGTEWHGQRSVVSTSWQQSHVPSVVPRPPPATTAVPQTIDVDQVCFIERGTKLGLQWK